MLVIGDCSPFEQQRWTLLLKQANMEYVSGDETQIPEHDIILCFKYVNVESFPDKKFLIYPPTSFPGISLEMYKDKKNCCIIHHSRWMNEMWRKLGINGIVKMDVLTLPISLMKTDKVKDQVFVYYENRNPSDEHFIKAFLEKIHVKNYKVITSIDVDWEFVKHCEYGMVLSSFCDQSFILDEVMACNIPLFVWDMKLMSQDTSNETYPPIFATSIPHFDNRCGSVFQECNEFKHTWPIFQDDFDSFSPESYVTDEMSPPVCARALHRILDGLEVKEVCQSNDSTEVFGDHIVFQEIRPRSKTKRSLFTRFKLW